MFGAINLLYKSMEDYQGDLTDILRATTGGGGTLCTDVVDAAPSSWEFNIPSDTKPILLSQAITSTSSTSSGSNFGYPFSNMQDPLLNDLNLLGFGFFTNPAASFSDHRHHHAIISKTCTITSTRGGGGGGGGGAATASREETTSSSTSIIPPSTPPSPCNIFSRIHISTPPHESSPPPPPPLPVVSVSPMMINANNSSSSGCLNNTTPPAAVQISSPRNLGIKRRKSQAKKVVCIPAPAAPNSRPSGEIVPSDLWAWRKYGQKPIKGSPYPRGYYRCSSSKGCSARKQVERSRADPNMLVITYTSEHNHPWPTQRNALAGSTRSHPPKTTTCSSSSSSKNNNTSQDHQEDKENNNNNNSSSISTPTDHHHHHVIKEEEKLLEFDHQFMSYKPLLADDDIIDGDFFADLAELEADTDLNLLLTQAAPKESTTNKADMDPFTLFDWPGQTK